MRVFSYGGKARVVGVVGPKRTYQLLAPSGYVTGAELKGRRWRFLGFRFVMWTRLAHGNSASGES